MHVICFFAKYMHVSDFFSMSFLKTFFFSFLFLFIYFSFSVLNSFSLSHFFFPSPFSSLPFVPLLFTSSSLFTGPPSMPSRAPLGPRAPKLSLGCFTLTTCLTATPPHRNSPTLQHREIKLLQFFS